jgi:hypothetical protein
MTTESGERPRVRASDAEREEYAAVVREAVGDGRLSLEEGEERQAKVLAARFRDELPPLVADLPGPGLFGRLGGAGGGFGGGAGGGAGGQGVGGPGGFGPFGRGRFGPGGPGCGFGSGEGAPDAATIRQWARARFARHITFALTLAAVLITIWALTGAHFFWPVIPLAFITIGLLKHGMWLRFAGTGAWGHRRW